MSKFSISINFDSPVLKTDDSTTPRIVTETTAESNIPVSAVVGIAKTDYHEQVFMMADGGAIPAPRPTQNPTISERFRPRSWHPPSEPGDFFTARLNARDRDNHLVPRNSAQDVEIIGEIRGKNGKALVRESSGTVDIIPNGYIVNVEYNRGDDSIRPIVKGAGGTNRFERSGYTDWGIVNLDTGEHREDFVLFDAEEDPTTWPMPVPRGSDKPFHRFEIGMVANMAEVEVTDADPVLINSTTFALENPNVEATPQLDISEIRAPPEVDVEVV